jgi:hypothetical protein
MARVLAKRSKEKLAERLTTPVKSFDAAGRSQNRVPQGIGSNGLPSALQAVEN